MTQDAGAQPSDDAAVDAVVRARIRSLRTTRGWSLDALAARCELSPSSLSRIETGHRRVALDQLVRIAQALDTTLDQLVESDAEEDVVIRPEPTSTDGMTTWILSRDAGINGTTVAKMRFGTAARDPHGQVHPGHDWFTVLTGVAELRLGARTLYVRAGEAAEFSTMTPHAIRGHGGPVEILTIFDRHGHRAHLEGGAD